MIGNPIDRGQMHSGDVLSEPFEHLRIIDDYYFYKAVEIIRGRASTKREGPLRTDSGGLLTGMIYCGECGERLTINHCRKVTDTLEGQREYRWSVYRCYRKINSRKTCTGQSTYNAKRIDEAVLSIVRSFFARITTLPEADQMQAAMQRENLIREKAIQTAEDDVEKATKALSALEDEALKTLSGESKLTLDTINRNQQVLFHIAQMFKTNPGELENRLEQQMNEMKDLRHELEKFKEQASLGEARSFLASAKTVGELKVITAQRDGMDAAAMRKQGDFLRDKEPGVVGVLASVNDGKVTLLAVCGKDAVAKGVKAGDIIKAIAPICGGKGGGKPDSAMGGGTEVSKVDDALAAVDDLVLKVVG